MYIFDSIPIDGAYQYSFVLSERCMLPLPRLLGIHCGLSICLSVWPS